jgi:hypothetical protein
VGCSNIWNWIPWMETILHDIIWIWLLSWRWLWIMLSSEDGGDTFRLNVGYYKTYKAPHPRRQHSSY